MNSRMLQSSFGILMAVALSGCATNFEPKPLAPDHPASAQAQEAPRAERGRLISADAITRKTVAQLNRKDAPNPDYENGGMSHDMGSMSGMDHSQMKGMDHSNMPGMDMSKKPPAAATPSRDMDHSQMPGMTMPSPAAAASPATAEPTESEIKAKPDAKGAYWTCVMHPEIHEDKPGKCPKCGMTLVKKEGVSK
ncbi:MAG: heavy metal-binding domain-containing protein [Chthoniobacterales bacterium]